MLLSALVVLVASASSEYSKVDDVDGITIESRPVEGSKFVELKFSTVTTKTPASLCAEAFGSGKFDPEEPDLKSRVIISESENQRVTYDRITPPVVSNRDYAVKATRSWDGTTCKMSFEAANDQAPKLEDGWVRVNLLRGYWTFVPIEGGKTRLTYVVFTDPGGSIPAFMVEGSRKKLGVKWVKLIVGRAKEP